MKELLNKARARVIRHLVLDKGALALTIGMGGVVILLLAGTDIMDWYWPLLLAAVSLGVGVYQLRRYVPTRYQLAQRIDKKLALADSLSTAVYFSENPKPALESVCAAQYRAADGLAGSVNLEQALPMSRSRYLFPAAVLLAVAFGLFVTRYVMIGSLDLQGSLVAAAVDTFFTAPADQTVAKATRPDLRPRPFDPSQPAAPPEEGQQLPPDAEKGKELQNDSNQKQDASDGDKSNDQQGDKGDSGDVNNDSPQDSNKQPKDNDREGQDKGDNDSQGQDKRSMLDKLRDAAQNIMNKMSSSEPKQTNAKNDSQQQKGQKSDKAGKGDDDANQDSQADAQPNSDDPDGKGKPNPKQEKDNSKESSDKGASGNGDKDGKKDVEEAKAEEAMGKVSELLTQRSNTVSGEMTVEVGSTNQQLKTALTQQNAGHADAGGEIHRDRVPLADQMFVERYFQEIRKPGKVAPVDSKTKSK